MRETPDAEARVMQERQARATVRKLTRRLESSKDFGRGYRNFLMACRVDVANVVESPPA